MSAWTRTRAALAALPERFHDRYLQDFVFIHINKTGGSSIERALGIRFEHRTALEKRAELGTPRFEQRFRFSMVRNPWDRVASHYSYRVQTNQTGLGEHPLPFGEWVRRSYRDRDPRYYDKPRMFMPQLDWLCDVRGRLLVDFVGRFERLRADFDLIRLRLGVVAAPLPHLKSSAKGDYRRLYDSESTEIVARHFARDIERFGYAFDDAAAD